jgi:REP element-mobilizing transposase RayT
MQKYRNKYRIKSTRLQNWNYGRKGAYFITICTHNQKHYFGEIINNNMVLSEIGKIAKSEWIKTFKIRGDMNLEMGEYVIMPNHIHGIIIIGDNEYNLQYDTQCRDAMHRVSTDNNHRVSADNKFGPQSKNLASIIRGYKSSVTTYAHKNGIDDFAWQSRFYDHIIRNEKSFNNISEYIINNPMNWKNDKFNMNNDIRPED